jgi:hypothetical protein
METTIMARMTEAEKNKQYRELAAAIADQAQVIADGTGSGPVYARVQLLKSNVARLEAWTPDDRYGMAGNIPASGPRTVRAGKSAYVHPDGLPRGIGSPGVLVDNETGTAITVTCQAAGDERYGADGQPLPRGRCDTCGAPCSPDEGGCTADPAHETALS